LAGAATSPSENGAGTPAAPGSARPFGRRPTRTFALAIALPALVFYIVAALIFIAALVNMAREIDRMEEQRGLTAVAAALETFLNVLSDSVADEGTWNEAHLNVVVQPDPAWMDATWGATARLATSYDDAIVTDQDGKIVFGENNLGAISGVIGDHYPSAPTILEELDQAITAGGDAAVVAHFAGDAEGITSGLAAISIHKSTPGEIAVPRHQRRILWIAKQLTPTILQDIAVRYQVPLPRMISEPSADLSSISINDADGKTAGVVAWEADQPGEVAFRHVVIPGSALFFAIGVGLLIGLRALRRTILRRASVVEEAFVEQVRDAQIAVAAAEVVATTRPATEDNPLSAIDGVSASDFTVEYEPIFDLRAEALIGVEALVRWNRTDKSVVRQEELTPIECATLMDRAGIIVLRHAAGELAPLLGVTLSLAATPDQILSGVFAEKVGGTLRAMNFQVRRLQLHVDTTVLPPVERLAAPIAELRQMGVTVALSNFVLGERTAQYLRPDLADRICLARSMVDGADVAPAHLKLVEATIEAAREVGCAVTVPFVAQKAEAAKLLRLGCREFRGPLLASPMPLAALTALILAPARPAKTG
jgi:EAL domain-containing protein (putative c-di-GMP-specific phosphodiesterase class I)/sensor domain CHASE-containing protein